MDFENIIAEIERNKELGLFSKPKKTLLDFLILPRDEEILINMRLFPLKNVFKNDIRERYAKRLILTTTRVIFVLNKGYILKESFLYSQITGILITKKWYISSDHPVIIIQTENDKYEILFVPLFSHKKKIQGIVECIRKRNPKLNIEIDPKYEEHFLKDILFTKIKFK